MNYGDIVNDFLCEVRERGGFANDKAFDQIVGQVFFDKFKTAIEEEREACAKIAHDEAMRWGMDLNGRTAGLHIEGEIRARSS
jgi:hypothetical protein